MLASHPPPYLPIFNSTTVTTNSAIHLSVVIRLGKPCSRLCHCAQCLHHGGQQQLVGLQEIDAQQQKARVEADARLAAMQKDMLKQEDQERAELEKEYK